MGPELNRSLQIDEHNGFSYWNRNYTIKVVVKLLILTLFFACIGLRADDIQVSSYKVIFEEVSTVFEKNFFDRRFKNLPLKPMLARYGNQIESPMDSVRFK